MCYFRVVVRDRFDEDMVFLVEAEDVVAAGTKVVSMIETETLNPYGQTIVEITRSDIIHVIN